MMVEQARPLNDVVYLRMELKTRRLARQALDQGEERVQCGRRSGSERAGRHHAGARFPQRQCLCPRTVANSIETACPDPPCWQVDDALEGGIVAAVGKQPQVGERVLDLGALEES